MPNIHLPGRKPKAEAPKVTVVSLEGTLRRLAEKDLMLQTSGSKVLRFRLIARTEFRGKDGKPIRDSLLHPGDRLTIDTNPDDPETALHVILVRTGSSSERETAAAPVEQARISTPESSDFGRPHGTAESASEPAPSTSESSDGEAPPRLQRKPESGTGTGEPAPPVKKIVDNSVDGVIADAREASSLFSSELPDFLVQQVTTRYSGSRFVDNWRARDVVTADVASVDGKEEYRNIRVNGNPTTRPEDSGSWSRGEFQVTLEDILSPQTSAAFTARGEDRVANRPALVFDLSVEQARSHLALQTPDGRQYKSAYKGTIWIDKDTRRVLRIEQRAVGLPRNYAFDRSESTLEYGFVSIDGKRYLLPVQSVNTAWMTGTSTCSRNVIDFRNYRKFTADSNITFAP